MPAHATRTLATAVTSDKRSVGHEVEAQRGKVGGAGGALIERERDHALWYGTDDVEAEAEPEPTEAVGEYSLPRRVEQPRIELATLVKLQPRTDHLVWIRDG